MNETESQHFIGLLLCEGSEILERPARTLTGLISFNTLALKPRSDFFVSIRSAKIVMEEDVGITTSFITV